LATLLKKKGIACTLLDFRHLAPLNKATLYKFFEKTGSLLVVSKNYRTYGISGELVTVFLEAWLLFKYVKICTGGKNPLLLNT
jgi:pyruvate/2-oxoglutarate/acetoin dehydrogenase E1 component